MCGLGVVGVIVADADAVLEVDVVQDVGDEFVAVEGRQRCWAVSSSL